jgi:uncharacterized protein (DUF1810 family)
MDLSGIPPRRATLFSRSRAYDREAGGRTLAPDLTVDNASDNTRVQHEDVAGNSLARFLTAQDGVYDQALAEVRAGRKRSHWMWFVFPQLQGLGVSAMARRFAISGAAEARDYLRHPVLGARLVEISEAVLALDGRTAREVFGTPDDLKLRSSATLFARISPDGSVFHKVLDTYFDGQADPRTLQLLDDADKRTSHVSNE